MEVLLAEEMFSEVLSEVLSEVEEPRAVEVLIALSEEGAEQQMLSGW